MTKIFRVTTVPISLKILLQGQLKFMSQFFDVIAISSCGGELDFVEKSEGVRTVALEMTRKITPFKDLLSIIKMIILCRKEKPIIIHSHTPKAGLVSMVAGFFAGVPIRIHTVAGLPLMEARGLRFKLLVFVEKVTYSFATQIWPNSFVLKSYILDNDLTNENKVKVIHNGSSNGIDLDHFQNTTVIKEKALEIRKESKLSDSDFTFVFVGRIVEDKGCNELIHAFNELCNKFDKIKLLIVGNFEKSLSPISKESETILERNCNIILTGFQSDVRPYFSLADVFVFPSYREGFPNVVLQSLAMDTPCIVTDINGCNEIVADGVNGFLIKTKSMTSLNEKMTFALKNKDKLNEMSLSVRGSIDQKYGRSELHNKIKNEYDSILKKYQDGVTNE